MAQLMLEESNKKWSHATFPRKYHSGVCNFVFFAGSQPMLRFHRLIHFQSFSMLPIKPEPGAPFPFEEEPPWGSDFTESEKATMQRLLEEKLGKDQVCWRPGPLKSIFPPSDFVCSFIPALVGYLPTDRTFEEANRVFGVNNWSSEIKELEQDFIDEEDGKVTCGMSAVVRITLRNGVFKSLVNYSLFFSHIERILGMVRLTNGQPWSQLLILQKRHSFIGFALSDFRWQSLTPWKEHYDSSECKWAYHLEFRSISPQSKNRGKSVYQKSQQVGMKIA